MHHINIQIIKRGVYLNNYKRVEDLLRNYKMFKVNITNIESEIEFVKNDISVNGIDYAGISVSPTNVIKSISESKALCIIEEVDRLEKEVTVNRKLIDKIDRTLNGLEETERIIVEEKYINSLQWWQVACKVGYGERQCRRMRNNAINKLVVGMSI